MAEKILNTRVQLRYDSLENWASKNPTLKTGEVAIAYLPPKGNGEAPAASASAVLMKVGPGAFNALPWMSALAADVFGWAKETGLTVQKDGTGNVVSGVEWDATLNNGKGGIKYTTAAVATAEGLGDLQKAVAAIEKEIDEKEAGWAHNTTYTFTQSEDKKTLTITDTDGGSKAITFDYLNNADVTAILGSYYTKSEADAKFVEEEGFDARVQAIKVESAAHADSADEATHAASATHADAATKVDNALTVKVGGADVVFDGSASKTADVDAAIAAAIDAIPEVVHPEYSIVKDTTSEYAATYHLTKDGVNVGAAINIPKDLVVESGEVKTLDEGVWGSAGTYIVLTLANATNDKIYVRVDDLIEYVTSGSTNDSQVIVAIDDDHKVTATIGAGKIGTTELANNAVTTDKITDKNVTEAKLEQNVQDALALARTALQSHQDISGKADKVTGATAGNFAGLDANGNLTDSGKKAADFEVAGAAEAAKAELIGQSGDAATADTIYGVKAYAATAVSGLATGAVASNTEAIADINETLGGYGDIVTHNVAEFATSAQGGKADTAVQTITPVAGNGLKATKTGTDVSLDWDETITFVFNCGDANGNPLV